MSLQQAADSYIWLSLDMELNMHIDSYPLQLTVNGDFHCEASYYNEKLSVWEPLLEPLENSNGRLEQWLINAEVGINLINMLNNPQCQFFMNIY